MSCRPGMGAYGSPDFFNLIVQRSSTDPVNGVNHTPLWAESWLLVLGFQSSLTRVVSGFRSF